MIYAVNWLGVIIAAVGSFIIGFLWFGPLFGKKWMDLIGFTPEKVEEARKKGMSGMAGQMIASMISSIVTAFIFFAFAANLLFTGMSDLIVLAILLWIGFIVPPILNGSLWEGKSWSLFWITSTQILVSLLFMALVYSWFV